MIRVLCRLFRLRLVLANAVAAVGGYLLFPAPPEPAAAAALFAAVFLLVSGASALNQVMERDLDRLMERTAGRPLPQGELTAGSAGLIGAACCAAALLVLLRTGGVSAALTGGVGLGWYLAIYTPLKRRTPFALPLGALCGALPPVVGWCTAGGSSTDFRILLLAAVLYLWQVPHFWLLQHRHRADYRKASLPLFECGFATPRALLWGTWVTALLAVTALFPVFRLMAPAAAVLCALCCCATWSARALPLFHLLPVLFTVALYLER